MPLRVFLSEGPGQRPDRQESGTVEMLTDCGSFPFVVFRPFHAFPPIIAVPFFLFMRLSQEVTFWGFAFRPCSFSFFFYIETSKR